MTARTLSGPTLAALMILAAGCAPSPGADGPRTVTTVPPAPPAVAGQPIKPAVADQLTAPAPAPPALPIVLEPEFNRRAASARGCRIPVFIEDESGTGLRGLGIIAQARDADGRFLEEKRLTARREPLPGRIYYTLRLGFSRPTCRAMRSVTVTAATCAPVGAPAGPCVGRLDLVDPSSRRLRLRIH